MKRKYIKLIVFLFILNSITLSLYFSSHPDYFRRRLRSTQAHHSDQVHQFTSLSSSNKPWPILPSYLPWSSSSTASATPSFRSCESYFGNGFTRRLDLLRPSPNTHRKSLGAPDSGWFRCFYSQTLRSSICEGGRLRMHPDKIKMSTGGEVLETVIGRREEEELPEFGIGAFDIQVTEKSKRSGEKVVGEGFLNEYLENGKISKHTMRELVDSIRLIGANEFKCNEVR